jgi:hypothetical protein
LRQVPDRKNREIWSHNCGSRIKREATDMSHSGTINPITQRDKPFHRATFPQSCPLMSII